MNIRAFCGYAFERHVFILKPLSSAAASAAASATATAAIVVRGFCGRKEFVNRESYIIKEIARLAFGCRRTFLGRNTEINRINQELGIAFKTNDREKSVRYVYMSYIIAYHKVIIKTVTN